MKNNVFQINSLDVFNGLVVHLSFPGKPDLAIVVLLEGGLGLEAGHVPTITLAPADLPRFLVSGPRVIVAEVVLLFTGFRLYQVVLLGEFIFPAVS